MKIRTKFAVSLLVLTLVLGGVVYGQLELAKDRSVARTQENVDQTAALTAEQIDAQIRQEKNYVGFFASQPAASNFSNSEAFLERFLANPHVFAGQIIAANGTVVDFRGDVTSEVRQEAIGADRNNRSYVQRTARTGEIIVTAPERVGDSEQFIVVVSAPIFEDGEIAGVLVAGVPVNEFTFFTMVGPLETDRQAVAIRADGRTLHGSHQTFEEKITSTATVESTGWSVRITRDRSPLNARLQEMAVTQVASLALVLSLVVALSVLEYNSNVRQAQKLLDSFESLREGDYDASPQLSSGEEWRQIRAGFEELATGLDEREAALRERKQRLQVFNRVLRHNLRNDMTVVVNYAELVEEQTDDPAVRDAAAKILSRSEGLVGLGEKAQQIEQSLAGYDGPVTVDVCAEIRTVVSTLREEYPQAEITSEMPERELARAIPALDAAVEDLCENAVEHSDVTDPTVTITVDTVAEDADRWVRIAVADDGPGISEYERDVLLSGRETDLEHSSGFGLWLVSWIVERSGGRLSFAENEPRGTVVELYLEPASEETA